MARRVICGWESGQSSQCDYTDSDSAAAEYGVTLVDGEVVPAFGSSRYAAMGDGVAQFKIPNTSEIYYRDHFYCTVGLPASTTYMWLATDVATLERYHNGNQNSDLNLELTSAGVIEVWRDHRNAGAGTKIAESAAVVAARTWYTWWIWYKVHNTTGRVVVRLKQKGAANYTTIIDFTGDTQGAQNTTGIVNLVGPGRPTAFGGTRKVIHDDIICNDTTGTVNNSWPDDGEIIRLAPIGMGAGSNNLSGTSEATDRWKNVDETPPSDADYVSDTVAGEYDLYTLTDPSAIPSGAAIALWARVGYPAGASTFKFVAKTSAETRSGALAPTVFTTSPPPTGVDGPWYRNYILEQEPVGAIPWTLAAIQALEAGPEVSSAAEMRIYQFLVEVDGAVVLAPPPDPPPPPPSGGGAGAGDGGSPDLSLVVYPPGSTTPIDLSREFRNLRWRNTVPGGYGDCSFEIPRDIYQEYRELLHWGRVVRSDGQDIRFDGRIEGSSRVKEGSEQRAKIQAYGLQRQVTGDDRYRGAFRETRLDAWTYEGSLGINPAASVPYLEGVNAQVAETASGNLNELRVFFPPLNETLPANVGWDVRYVLPKGWERMQFSRFRFVWWCNATPPANARLQVFAMPPGPPDDGSFWGGGAAVYQLDWTTTTQTVEISPASFPAGCNAVYIRVLATSGTIGSGGMGPSGRIIFIKDVAIYGTAKDGGAPSAPLLRASDVVDEVLAASCPLLARSSIQQSAQTIEQLVYLTSTLPADILNEMLIMAPNDPLVDALWYWAVWEKFSDGTYRTDFREYPAGIRYLVRGVNLDVGSDAAGQFNKAVVTYKDAGGVEREIKVTQTIEGLNFTRTLPIDAGTIKDQVKWQSLGGISFPGVVKGSAAATATRIGNAALRLSRWPRRSTRITVGSDKVRDATTGVYQPYWRINPGLRIRAEELFSPPTIDLEADPGVFMISGVEVSEPNPFEQSGSATLELDSAVARLDLFLAALGKRRF